MSNRQQLVDDNNNVSNVFKHLTVKVKLKKVKYGLTEDVWLRTVDDCGLKLVRSFQYFGCFDIFSILIVFSRPRQKCREQVE